MKNFFKRFWIWLVLAAMFAMLIPSVASRVENEKNNNRVVVSLLYNDLRNKVSSEKVAEVLENYKKLGVNTISVMEDDINSMVARGEVTCIKYNTLKHKYDEESIILADYIGANYPSVSYDSYLLISKNEAVREKLAQMLPMKYNAKDYIKIEGLEGMDVYALYNGREKLWNYTFGFDRQDIEMLKNEGFEIALIYKVKNYSRQDYIEYIEKIVDDYDVEYFNLKTDAVDYDEDDIIKKNYRWIGQMINKNDMTLVVTENISQLSNQKCLGYDVIFKTVMHDAGSRKVLRAYENYDDSQADETHYEYRANQYFNSSVDRNIRFITVTQIAAGEIPFDECADYTLKAVKEYMERASECGFVFDGRPEPFDYNTNLRIPSACCAVIMVFLVLLTVLMVFGIDSKKLKIAAVIVAALAFAATFVLPLSLVLLYPTVYCLVVSCFAMAVIMKVMQGLGKKYNTLVEILIAVVLMLVILCIGALGMGSMLSGINYYINNYIFRGIKLSLMIPPVFAAIAFYFISCTRDKNKKLGETAVKILKSDIKVYWVLIGAFIGIIGMYYIVRSGNVNRISSLEQAMRTAITNAFPARPRTKEFLIGYPSLVLFVYYMRNTNLKLVQWFFAVGTSILSASVMNSFCHVFTDLTIIYQRVVNGVLIGAIVAVFAFVANAALVRIVKTVAPAFKNPDVEMK